MIHWGSLLIVQLVSFGATITVVGLVSVAVVGLSARVPASTSGQHVTTFAPRSGTAVGAICLVAAALVVLFGLWEIVAR
ncbi:hypothetical protein BJF90_36320 [Pseudonocardia sp. CNS-004]|jgi:uncharacterized membrane protein|nr:hypothetical protein BJF90_36320 [Pseudonocardia sp. CNS-004]